MSEFKHFIQVILPPQEIPSYLEIVILMICDIRRAFARWRNRAYSDVHEKVREGDRGDWCKLYRVPYYWFDMTCKHYIVAIVWKLKQLIKLTLGIWVRPALCMLH